MKFQKKKRKPAPYYGKAAREAMREQMWIECGKALLRGESTDGVTAAYNIAVNPVSK